MLCAGTEAVRTPITRPPFRLSLQIDHNFSGRYQSIQICRMILFTIPPSVENDPFKLDGERFATSDSYQGDLILGTLSLRISLSAAISSISLLVPDYN